MLTNNEILKKLRLQFTDKELELFSKIEAEKYRLIGEESITEEPKYEIEYWENKSKDFKKLNNKKHGISDY